MPPSFEVLTSDCAPDVQCSKIVRRHPGVLTVVGAAVTDPEDVASLGVGLGEGAVDISEELMRAAYLALTRVAS